MKKNNDINSLREKIDQIDEKLMQLIGKRGDYAKKIGSIKQGHGKKIYVPSREREIFKRLSKLNNGPYSDTALFQIFRELISATRALEQPIRVAFLGPEATFTHKAAVSHFGQSAEFHATDDIASVFQDVAKGQADFGVVPIENSTEGVVNYTLDKFVDSELKICSEVILSVELNLLSAEKDWKNINKIYSHPHALAQCRNWIARHLPKAKCYPTDSTAEAARQIARSKNAGAIASSFAADAYGMNILVEKVQDQVNNFTRFLVLGQEQAGKTGNDKTSICFVGKDKPGILYQLLQPLADAKINLTKIESRPLKSKAWEYMFFADLDGHVSERKVQNALQSLKEECASFKVLGSYPKAVWEKGRR